MSENLQKSYFFNEELKKDQSIHEEMTKDVFYAMSLITLVKGGIVVGMKRFASKVLGRKEHEKPHIHVKHAEYFASYDFDGNVLAGRLPPKKDKALKDWIWSNEDELKENWDLVLAGKDPKNIN